MFILVRDRYNGALHAIYEDVIDSITSDVNDRFGWRIQWQTPNGEVNLPSNRIWTASSQTIEMDTSDSYDIIVKKYFAEII